MIDTHGLSVKFKIGDLNLKVDLLNELLDKVLPRKSSAPAFELPLSATVSPSERRQFSRFSLASPASSITSPVYSLTSSIFSPSSLFSPSDVASPKRPLLSPTSMLLSPRSPISASFKALSVRHVIPVLDVCALIRNFTGIHSAPSSTSRSTY